MNSANVAEQVREAELLLARRNYTKALDVYAALIKDGVGDLGIFTKYRQLYNIVHGQDVPHAQIFDFIYGADLWEGGSGAGSFPQATETYRSYLKEFMARHDVRSVVDVGCGDWQSSQLIDWTGIDYLGIDVSSVVLNNTKRFARNGIRFIVGDARTIDLPEADLLIIKDVLQHWSNADIMAIIPKFGRFRYCLIANGATEQVRHLTNADTPAGGYRPVDLSKPPFAVPGTFVLDYNVPYVTRADGSVCSAMRVFLIDREKPYAALGQQTAPPVPELFAHEYDLNSLQLLTPRGHDFRMYVTPRYRDHYETRSYEQLSANLISSILRRADLFVDVGASYGFYSLLAASRRPDLDIISVEPTPETCTILKRNVGLLAQSKIAVLQSAVSDTVGIRRFNVAIASDSCGFFDHPNIGSLRSIDVETTTIDTLLKDRPAGRLVIKIDTEGNELAVLRGMTETLKRFEDIRLIIEFCPGTLRAANVQPNTLLEHLDRLGFATFLLDEGQGRYYRAKSGDDKLRLTGSDYANLYCVRKERSVNICLFSHAPALGGAERVLVELVDGLIADHGAICSVILPGAGPLVDSLVKIGAATFIAPYRWWCTNEGFRATETQKSDFIRESELSFSTAILPYLRLVDPDVIWTQTMVIPWGALAAAKLNKPHVWHVTEFGERDHNFNFFSPLSDIARDIEAASDLIYTCSDAVARELFPGAPNERVRTLYCPPSINENRNGAGSELTPYFRSPDAVKLGIFAFVQPSKGQEDIVRAVGELTHRGRNVELLVAGAEAFAEYRQHLNAIVAEYQIADRVHFTGALENPFPAMRATDIVVICSRCEAFGRTGIEAMLLGKPVIYPDTGGIAEYMRDGQTGLAYTAGDVDSLVDRIELLISDPSRRSAMGNFGKAHASKLSGEGSVSRTVNDTLLELRKRKRPTIRIPAAIERSLPSAEASRMMAGDNIRRNDPCPCGSGKRFKHCHGMHAF